MFEGALDLIAEEEIKTCSENEEIAFSPFKSHV
jgi:hypothetical protein